MFCKENNKMKITKEQLKQIIKEEIESIIGESGDDEELEEARGETKCTRECKDWDSYGGKYRDYSDCMNKCKREEREDSDRRLDRAVSQGRFQESKKFTKSNLQKVVREEIKNLLKRK